MISQLKFFDLCAIFVVSKNKTPHKKKYSMVNLLNNKLKVKLTAFTNLTQMELFRDIDESVGVLDRMQAEFINCYSLCQQQPAQHEAQKGPGRPPVLERA